MSISNKAQNAIAFKVLLLLLPVFLILLLVWRKKGGHRHFGTVIQDIMGRCKIIHTHKTHTTRKNLYHGFQVAPCLVCSQEKILYLDPNKSFLLEFLCSPCYISLFSYGGYSKIYDFVGWLRRNLTGGTSKNGMEKLVRVPWVWMKKKLQRAFSKEEFGFNYNKPFWIRSSAIWLFMTQG